MFEIIRVSMICRLHTLPVNVLLMVSTTITPSLIPRPFHVFFLLLPRAHVQGGKVIGRVIVIIVIVIVVSTKITIS